MSTHMFFDLKIFTILLLLVLIISFSCRELPQSVESHNIGKAINMPRIHHQWKPDVIDFEKFAINENARDNLIKMGYVISDLNTNFKVLGDAEGIMADNVNHLIYGVADPRGSGSAEGF